MLLLRLLLLTAIVYIIFLVLKSLLLSRKGRSSGAAQLGEAMVLDPQCQTYVPMSEAVARGGKYFCSEECAQRYLADRA
jgi:YHS domain-containing protein